MSGSDPWQDHLHSETRSAGATSHTAAELAVPALSLVWHPSLDRIGEQILLPELTRGETVRLSRLEPIFPSLTDAEPRPLADPRISRRAILLAPHDSGLRLDLDGSRTVLRVDGLEIDSHAEITADRLDGGVLLAVANRVLLLLHRQVPALRSPPDFGLVGRSDAMVHIRREIERVAPLDVTVLVCGESGTGKELVARALQRAGRRRDRDFVTLNMAAVTPSLAASELFGASKGAYSGANRARPGYFQRADGGTLFLDEIGETPTEVQPLLLRALENGEVQPVGGDDPVHVDVRVIAATDAKLEQAVEEGRFRGPLLHRLANYVIELPPLRSRREDLGPLTLFFLRQEVEALGLEDKLDDLGPYGSPWFPATLVEKLALYGWPGNVRQLRHVIRQLVISGRDHATVEPDARLERMLTAPTGGVSAHAAGDRATVESSNPGKPSRRRAPARAYRDPSTVDEDELESALAAHGWQPKPAAEALGISRASLYALIERSSRIRKASELERTEIELAMQKHGEPEKMVEALRVSKQGLKMRMRELGL